MDIAIVGLGKMGGNMAQRLLLEALSGDVSLFTRSDSIEAAWHLVDPVLRGWEAQNDPPLASYPVGSWGPAEGDDKAQSHRPPAPLNSTIQARRENRRRGQVRSTLKRPPYPKNSILNSFPKETSS